jgi:structure-specific recognition protein 1
MHIRFEEIACVNFARGGGSTKSFDFEIELKMGTTHTFSSIEKEEYTKLYDFIVSKKITVKNTGKMTSNYNEDFGDSDKEEPDAYLARVKAEAEERDSEESGSDEESTDEDFNPNEQESDVAEEFDSNVSTSDSEANSEDSEGKTTKKKEKKERHREKREKKTSSPKKKVSKKSKGERDKDAPKRAQSAFMIWMNEHREQIKEENPGIKVTEIAKKAGEMWNVLKDKSEWEAKAGKEKERYTKAMDEYKEAKSKGEKRKTDDADKSTPTKTTGSGSGFKSKEYISEDDSSSDGEKGKSKKKKVAFEHYKIFFFLCFMKFFLIISAKNH